MFGAGRFQTHLGSLIYKSTDSDMLVGVDWDLFMKIVDGINNACKFNDSRILDNVIECLEKRLKSSTVDDLEYTLQLIHTIVLNSDAKMVKKFASEQFLQSIYKCARNKKVRISHRALNLIRDWGEVFPRSSRFEVFPHFYHTLRSNGVTFPPRDSKEGTDEAISKRRAGYQCLKTSPAPSSASSQTGATTQYVIPEGLKKKFVSGSPKFDSAMHTRVQLARQLLQMIYQTPPGARARNSAVLQEMAGSLLSVQTQIQALIRDTAATNLAEHIISQLILLNDGVNYVLAAYEKRCQDPLPQQVQPKPKPKPAANKLPKSKQKANQALPGATRQASHDHILRRSNTSTPKSFSFLGAPPGSKRIAPKRSISAANPTSGPPPIEPTIPPSYSPVAQPQPKSTDLFDSLFSPSTGTGTTPTNDAPFAQNQPAQPKSKSTDLFDIFAPSGNGAQVAPPSSIPSGLQFGGHHGGQLQPAAPSNTTPSINDFDVFGSSQPAHVPSNTTPSIKDFDVFGSSQPASTVAPTITPDSTPSSNLFDVFANNLGSKPAFSPSQLGHPNGHIAPPSAPAPTSATGDGSSDLFSVFGSFAGTPAATPPATTANPMSASFPGQNIFGTPAMSAPASSNPFSMNIQPGFSHPPVQHLGSPFGAHPVQPSAANPFASQFGQPPLRRPEAAVSNPFITPVPAEKQPIQPTQPNSKIPSFFSDFRSSQSTPSSKP